MPIYEYQCEACHKVVEVWQKISDPAPTECSCGAKNSYKRKVSMTSFVLKGTGWYVTDFRDKGNSGATGPQPPAHKKDHEHETESTSSASETSAPKTETASESKPAETKAESKPESKSSDTKAA